MVVLEKKVSAKLSVFENFFVLYFSPTDSITVRTYFHKVLIICFCNKNEYIQIRLQHGSEYKYPDSSSHSIFIFNGPLQSKPSALIDKKNL